MPLQLTTFRMPRAPRLRPAGLPDALARVVAAALSASLVLTLAGCETPVLQSTVQVPDQFASAPASEAAAEVAWWERFADPTLSELIQRAAHENRDIRIAAERVRAARAGETISRSWLLPSFGVAASGGDQRTGYSGSAQQAVPDMKIRQRRTQRLMGNRPQRTTAGGCSGRRRGHEGHRGPCARGAPAGALRCRVQLLHARWRTPAARDGSRHLRSS